MSSTSPPKARIACPHCSKELMVPVSAAGKTGKCPQCTNTFKIPARLGQPAPAAPRPAAAGPQAVAPAAYRAAAQPAAAPPAGNDLWDDLDYQLKPAEDTPSLQAQQSQSLMNTRDVLENASQAKDVRRSSSGGGGFSGEIVGGLVAMAIAVVWFIGGLSAGYIFFYPPILFIGGLISFCKGLCSSG